MNAPETIDQKVIENSGMDKSDDNAEPAEEEVEENMSGMNNQDNTETQILRNI